MIHNDFTPASKLSPQGFLSSYTSHGVLRQPHTDFPAHPEQQPSHQLHAPKRYNEILRGYVLTDIFAMLAGYMTAWLLASAVNALFFERALLGEASDHNVVRLAEFIAISASVLLTFQHMGHYRLRIPFWMEARNIVTAMCLAMIVDGFLQFTSKQAFSRLFIVTGWLIAAMFIIVFRAFYRMYLRRADRWKIATLLVGEGAAAHEVREALATEPGLGYEVVAQIKDLPSEFMHAGRSWANLCREYNAQYVIMALDAKDMAGAHQPIAQLQREEIGFSVSAQLYHLPVLGIMPQYFLNHDVLMLAHSSGLEQPIPRFLKRMVDIGVSFGALLALSPLMLLLAALVRMDGGPALYSHSRIGRKGNQFACLKFRSMIRNSETALEKYLAEHPEARVEWEEAQKLKFDPRVTWLGGFMRRSSLDELPQLINVLKGDMSLVGPRPIVTEEVQKYESDIAHYYRVRPGITGLWQVSGRNDVSYAQRVQMDSWYVRNWSLWHDIAIICKTFPALFRRSGAY